MSKIYKGLVCIDYYRPFSAILNKYLGNISARRHLYPPTLIPPMSQQGVSDIQMLLVRLRLIHTSRTLGEDISKNFKRLSCATVLF